MKYYWDSSLEPCPFGLTIKSFSSTVMNVGRGYCQECEFLISFNLEERYIVCSKINKKYRTVKLERILNE